MVRLQESIELLNSQTASLDEVLGGASPDYAVIAQKAAGDAVVQLFDSAFDKEFGLTSHALIGRFDRKLVAHDERTTALEARLEERTHASLVPDRRHALSGNVMR